MTTRPPDLTCPCGAELRIGSTSLRAREAEVLAFHEAHEAHAACRRVARMTTTREQLIEEMAAACDNFRFGIDWEPKWDGMPESYKEMRRAQMAVAFDALLARLSADDPERVERAVKAFATWFSPHAGMRAALNAAGPWVVERDSETLKRLLRGEHAATDLVRKEATEQRERAEKAEAEVERLRRIETAARVVVDAEGPSQRSRVDFWASIDALRAALEGE